LRYLDVHKLQGLAAIGLDGGPGSWYVAHRGRRAASPGARGLAAGAARLVPLEVRLGPIGSRRRGRRASIAA
jgi:hypothetical protein